jgi:ribosomal protein S12 methylthiotransferase accessory factor
MTRTVTPPPLAFRDAELRSAKVFTAGTHRADTPAATFDRIRPYLHGAGVTRIADVTGLDRVGVPTVLAIRPNASTIACSSGKGVTLEQARVSGAMEAFELHAAETAQLPAVRASYREIAGKFEHTPAVHDLPLSHHSVFGVNWPFQWYCGWDIMRQAEVPVPLAVVGMSRTSGLTDSVGCFQVTSNGLGAGNTFLEAVLSALYEVIERDAYACNNFAALHRGHVIPQVSEGVVRSYPALADVFDRCDRAGVRIQVQDCTADTAVPTYNAIAWDREESGVGIVHGTGTHLDPEIAMLRAVTEALQARLNFIAGSRDDIFRSAFRRWRGDRERLAGALEASVAESPEAPRRVSDATDTFEEDAARVLSRLSECRLRSAVVADLTPPELPVHVVRVVVPGLEGYVHYNYSPGARAKAFLGNGGSS